MKPYEATQIASLLTTVATNRAFKSMGDDSIRCVARAVIDTELRDKGVPYTERVFEARNAIVRATVRLHNTNDESYESAQYIEDYLEGYVTGAFESAGVMEW